MSGALWMSSVPSWDGRGGPGSALRAALVWLCLAAVSPLCLELAENKLGRAYGHFIVDLPLLLLQPCISSTSEGIHGEGFAASGLLAERVCVLRAKKSSFLFQ